MADDRQFQIRERAGLEESKLNVEFIEFLRRWGTPMLLCVAAVVGVYALYNRWERSRQAEISTAFEELSAASAGGRPNPTSLLEVADRYASIKSVGLMARMAAADAWLQAVRQRVAIGAAIKNEDGTLLDEKTGALTQDLRDQYLNNAKQQYQTVLEATKDTAEKRLIAVSAAFGLAAVAESAGNFSDAKAAYETAKTLSQQAGDELHVEIATKRLASMDTITEAPLLLSDADLPKPPPPPPAPTPAPAPGTGPTPAGPAPVGPAPADAPPAGGTPPAANPTPTPAPTPAPAPADAPK